MSELPPNWTAAVDPASGRTYYANPLTGESTWDFPGQTNSIGGSTPPLPPPPSSTGPPPQSACPLSLGMSGRFVPPERHVSGGSSNPEGYLNTEKPRNDQNGPTKKAQAIAAKASSGCLVAAARELMDAKAATQENQTDLELYSLSSGQIVDLQFVQQEQLNMNEDGVFQPYLPINPFTLSECGKTAPAEAARLDIRLHSLHDKLKKIPR